MANILLNLNLISVNYTTISHCLHGFQRFLFSLLEATTLIFLETVPAATGTDFQILFESSQFNALNFR